MFDSTDFDPPGVSPPPPTVLEALTDPGAVAHALAASGPAGANLACLDVLDQTQLEERAGLALLTALETHAAWLAAQQQRLLAHLQHVHDRMADPDDPVSGSWLREEISCALHLAPRTARTRINTAMNLASRLPATLTLLGEGRISDLHARTLADAVVGLDDQVTAKVEARVLPRAPKQTVGEFRAAVRRAVLALNPADEEERHRDAVADRRVDVKPVADGMTEIWMYLPASSAAVFMEAVHCLASRTSGAMCPGDGAGPIPGACASAGDCRSADAGEASATDCRTADQRRADAVVEMAMRVLADPDAPIAHGLRPHVQVTIPLSSLLGIDETPADLDGYGPIPADIARDLASDPTSTWRRLIVDPITGILIDYGTTRYRPPPSLARYVMARDRECAFPHCHRPARRCDLDHITRWTDGGPTHAANLQPLCPRHHRAKDEYGWRVERDPRTGFTTWASPSGNVYTTDPAVYPLAEQMGCPTPTEASEDPTVGSSPTIGDNGMIGNSAIDPVSPAGENPVDDPARETSPDDDPPPF